MKYMIEIEYFGKMKIIRRIGKGISMLMDTSAIRLSREYHLDGIRKLNPLLTYFDSLWCLLRYFIRPNEYFYFAFYNKSSSARKTFIGDRHLYWIMFPKINSRICDLFNNKCHTYQFYKPYYKREVLSLTLPEDINVIKQFAIRHRGFVLKPTNLNMGRGIVFWDEGTEPLDCCLKRIKDSMAGGGILEEIIEQDPELASFHPSSVNTIRYAVNYTGDDVIRVFAIIRMGCGDSQIDNTHAGGICAAIDLESGVIESKGLSQGGDQFLFHPDTGKQILGTKIPKWEELNDLVEKLKPTGFPIRLVGWDFALSKNGWCIVEGNSGPSFRGIQGCLGKGYKSKLMEIKRRI